MTQKSAGIRIEGNGEHHFTKILDAATGDDLGTKYGISACRYEIGGDRDFPKARLILEVTGLVEVAIKAD